jgi:hypothetical protein
MTSDIETLMEFDDELGGLGAIHEEGAPEAVRLIQSPHSAQPEIEFASTDVNPNHVMQRTILGEDVTLVHAASDDSATDNYDSVPMISSEPASSKDSPSGEAAPPGPDSDDEMPDNNEPSATETALPLMEQENGIHRLPDNSSAPAMETQGFSQTRLDRLFALWDNNALTFLKSYAERCEIVYQIWQETAKPGCNGGFSAALRRIKLADSTAYDMVARHKVKSGKWKTQTRPIHGMMSKTRPTTSMTREQQTNRLLPSPGRALRPE